MALAQPRLRPGGLMSLPAAVLWDIEGPRSAFEGIWMRWIPPLAQVRFSWADTEDRSD